MYLLLFQCRFVIKYRHCTGELKVKITDDTVVSTNNLKLFIYIFEGNDLTIYLGDSFKVIRKNFNN